MPSLSPTNPITLPPPTDHRPPPTALLPPTTDHPTLKLGFPQTEEQWEVYYDHFVQKPKLAVRREMNRMKETNEILDLDLLDNLKEHELKELLPDRNNKATIPGL